MAFWVVLGIAVIAIVVSMLEIPALQKQKQKRELWAFSLLMILAIGLNVAVTLHVHLPNPFEWITAMYKPMNDIILGFLK